MFVASEPTFFPAVKPYEKMIVREVVRRPSL